MRLVLEILVYCVFVGLVVWEIAIPLWNETRLFPTFRRESRIEHDLKTVTESIEDLRLAKLVQDRRKRVWDMINELEKELDKAEGDSPKETTNDTTVHH